VSAKTKDERINEVANQLYKHLKEWLRFDLKEGGSCGRCDDLECSTCQVIKLIEWIDKKPLTL